jgi:hypothetical protein
MTTSCELFLGIYVKVWCRLISTRILPIAYPIVVIFKQIALLLLVAEIMWLGEGCRE